MGKMFQASLESELRRGAVIGIITRPEQISSETRFHLVLNMKNDNFSQRYGWKWAATSFINENWNARKEEIEIKRDLR